MKFVQPPFKGENKGHYTPGIISKGMLYVSGQLSIDPDTREVCRGDIRAHARLALGNVTAADQQTVAIAQLAKDG